MVFVPRLGQSTNSTIAQFRNPPEDFEEFRAKVLARRMAEGPGNLMSRLSFGANVDFPQLTERDGDSFSPLPSGGSVASFAESATPFDTPYGGMRNVDPIGSIDGSAENIAPPRLLSRNALESLAQQRDASNDPIMRALLSKPPITEGLFQPGAAVPGTIPELQARINRPDVPDYVRQGAQTHFEGPPPMSDMTANDMANDMYRDQKLAIIANGKGGSVFDLGTNQFHNVPAGWRPGGNMSPNLPDPFAQPAPVEDIHAASKRNQAIQGAIAGGATRQEDGSLLGRGDANPLAQQLLQRVTENRAKMAHQVPFVPQALRGGTDISRIRAMARGNERAGMDPRSAMALGVGMGQQLGDTPIPQTNLAMLGGLLGPGVAAEQARATGFANAGNQNLIWQMARQMMGDNAAVKVAEINANAVAKQQEIDNQRFNRANPTAQEQFRRDEELRALKDNRLKADVDAANAGQVMSPTLDDQLTRDYESRAWESARHTSEWWEGSEGAFFRVAMQKYGLSREALEKWYATKRGGHPYGTLFGFPLPAR